MLFFNQMVKDLFEYRDYRKYVSDSLDKIETRGARSRLAEALNCQPAFVSRVLGGDAHFSQEHAAIVNEFFEHESHEAEYFMLLLDFERAGTKLLREFHHKKLDVLRSKRQQIAERIRVQEGLSEENQVKYYSAWYYAAIHVLLMVPEFRTPQKIAERLKLRLSLVKEVLEFLLHAGLAKRDAAGYEPGVVRIHLRSDSPQISRHHLNWRVNVIQHLNDENPDNLHFSGPLSISHAAAKQIKELLLKLLADAEPVIRAAKDEDLFCVNLDLFRL